MSFLAFFQRRISGAGHLLPGSELWISFPVLGSSQRHEARLMAVTPKTLDLEMRRGSSRVEEAPPPGSVVHLFQPVKEHLYFCEGRLDSVAVEGSLRLRVNYSGWLIRAQRRLFHRFGLKRFFTVGNLRMPDGSDAPDLRAELKDISPEGIGFQLPVALPVGTRFHALGLVHPLLPNMQDVIYAFRVIWCRPRGWGAFRAGAVFMFEDTFEQQRLVDVLQRLQTDRLVWLARRLGG